ncbi:MULTISPECIES: transporter substrate-binding domain-containing protein [Vibrio]|uniref:transporter substrate-binding domain-containing protein n=1 Tax=Vibrio TaxID=662 RepID=UPI00142F1D47|nr:MULTISPECIES: transporter substrate-binding domain-containing protein [Vibrio]
MALVSVHASTLTAAQSVWPPFIHDGKPPHGVIVDIVEEAFESQGYTMELQIKPWSRAMKEVMRARTDALIAVWYTDKRAEKLLFSDSYLDSKQVIIAAKEDQLTYTGLPSLSGLSVGTITDYAYDQAFLISTQFERVEGDSLEQSIRRLQTKRVDAIISNERVAKYTLGSMKIDKNMYDFFSPSVSVNPLYIAIGLENPRAYELIGAFNQGLAEIKANGRYQEILRRHQE